MRKNYWKDVCLLLVGSLIATIYLKRIDPLIIKTNKEIVPDTIVVRDTILVENKIPKLCKKNVLAELYKQNIPHANIVLAQSIHETGNYKSKLCKTHNNILGLRKGNSYRRYDNYIECISDYKKLISSRYKGGDYYNFLQRIGYAEDIEYINKIKKYV